MAQKEKAKATFEGEAPPDSQEEVNHCAIVYGSLPPVTKKEQARLFNERIGQVKFLVATDAVGMGLNFNIQRIVFFTISKWIDRRS